MTGRMVRGPQGIFAKGPGLDFGHRHIHCAVCDLAWIWRRLYEFPNVFVDTAWFSAADQLAVYAHVPPGQILYATDIPFGTPALGVIGWRCRPA